MLRVPQLRIFTFTRSKTRILFPRIANVIGELGGRRRRNGIRLLIENRKHANAGTRPKRRSFSRLLPRNVGVTFGLV